MDVDAGSPDLASSTYSLSSPQNPKFSLSVSLSLSLSAGTAGRELGLDRERCAPPTETLATELMEYR
jgi:hypothetical protein